MAAAKAVMGMLGVDVGPARLPNTNFTVANRFHSKRVWKSSAFSNGFKASRPMPCAKLKNAEGNTESAN